MTGSAEQVRATLFCDAEAEDDGKTLLAQYQLLVATSEALVVRRQSVNTFFLSVNSIILAGEGLLLPDADTGTLESAAIIGFALGGMTLCVIWHRLITSFRQLSTGKFRVIHEIERRLPARMFTAEWVALGSGEDPKTYRPFTKVESATPKIFGLIQVLVAAGGLYLLCR
ncbi:RipA family octameric membrane protein [Candidatus Palauibacter sp.]|uniref:RipA family octameric membrane protein n=1 Tax=Candidatus Palauibacter sp. TaxID=3101350 RepID=UPI003B526F3A